MDEEKDDQDAQTQVEAEAEAEEASSPANGWLLTRLRASGSTVVARGGLMC